MKAILSTILLAITLCLSETAGAQTFAGEQDVTLSYGIYSGRQWADQRTMDANGDGTKETGNSGSIFASYKYFLDNRFSIGATAGFQTINGVVYYYDGVPENSYKMINKTVTGEMTFVYVNKHFFQMYILTGFGVSFSSVLSNAPVNNSYSVSSPLVTPATFEPATGTRFNFALDPVCIRIGYKLAGFLELGAGYKGVVNMGLSYQIQREKKISPAEMRQMLTMP